MGSLVVHFPDGSKEFRYPPRPVREGDVLWHDGKRYRVIHIAADEERPSVTVELVPEDLGDVLGSERGELILDPPD